MIRLEEVGLDTWAEALPSSGFEVFHRPAALRVLDEYTSGALRLYAGYKGEEVVGLLPVFVDRNPLGRAILSPPPSMGVSRLGPVVTPNSPKRRRRETVNRAFVEAVVDEIDACSFRSLMRVECPLAYDDPRPFDWAGLDVEKRFTYVLDLADTDADAVQAAFSGSLRRDIRNAQELDISIAVEGIDGAMAVYDDIDRRYAEQDASFTLSAAFYRDLLEALEDRWRAYVARDADGDYLAGITVLYSKNRATFWQGGARADHEGVSLNSLLHWRIIEDVLADPPLDSLTGYDLVGANTPRLCKYKAKFGADLVPYYTVESPGIGMTAAKRAYEFFAK